MILHWSLVLIFLIISDVELFFMCVLAIFLEKYLFRSSTQILIGLFLGLFF